MSDKEWEMAAITADIREVDEALFNFAHDPTTDNAVCVVREVARNMMTCMMCNVFERENCIEQRVHEKRGKEQLQATNQQLVEALTLADAALSGANIDMRQLSKKVNAAITNAKQREE